jgi:hypothetical protein
MSDLATLGESATVDPLVSHPADYHVFHQFLERCKKSAGNHHLGLLATFGSGATRRN